MNQNIISLSDVVKEEYRTYQIYTLMDRAIPYLEDGLKPGQRRILYTLWKNRSKGLLKVSSATGLVLTLHPHGPASIESTIANLAQDFSFSNNYPLLDKKGYFGERMEPTPAAGRYIEAKIGEVALYLLFDDLNQVQMVPNYDEREMEPVSFLPKLPLMLLNGAEGIGTGFSSVIPSFHHKDIIASIKAFLETGKAKKLKPYFSGYKGRIDVDKDKYVTSLEIEMIDGSFYITELPKGYDSTKIYKLLNKHVDEGFLRDYIDSSVGNDIRIELVFKKGSDLTLEEIKNKISASVSISPNYTLISERSVKIFKSPDEIIEIFSKRRLQVVRRRYELLAIEHEEKIKQNSEVIRFIKEKQYEVATKMKDRKSFVDHLKKNRYEYFDYLADMPIYRMTKDEVERRKALIAELKDLLAYAAKVSTSDKLVKQMLIKELDEVNLFLNQFLDKKEKLRKEQKKKLEKFEKTSLKKIDKKRVKKK